jgi:hypothetical protein
MPNSLRSQEHDEIQLLLPWYSNGTLGAADHERVRAHVISCAECQADIIVDREIHDVIRSDAAIPILPNRDAEEILEQSTVQSNGIGRWGIAPKIALAAGLVAMAIGLTMFARNDGSNVDGNKTYKAVTSPDSNTAVDYVFQLRFEDGVSDVERERIFAELGGTDIVLTENSSTYRVTLPLEATSMQQLEQISTDLQARPEVSSAKVIALQLPMR